MSWPKLLMLIIQKITGYKSLQYGFLWILLFFSAPTTSYGQDFEQALGFYESERFQEAANIFQQLDIPEATLFAGKCYYSLGQYLRAKSVFDRIPEDAPEKIYLEARYTSALSYFHLKQFGAALNILHEISGIRPRTPLVNDAIQFYNDILDYLTVPQRRDAFQVAGYRQVKHDLIQSAFGKVDYQTAKILLFEYEQTASMQNDSSSYRELRQMISDSLKYGYQIAFGNPLDAPGGVIYNIGAALPKFDNSAPEFSVSKGLYFGYILAAEEFNERNTNKKAFIRFQNTGADIDSAGYAITDLAWNYNVDVVLGPLFSEPALKMAKLAEQYQIPLLAPLANSDNLNIDNPYVFQANPTFSSHGRKVAEFAVKNLKMDTLAVLAERNSLGAASAYAFRQEAEKLGAHVAHFFVEDLAAQGYEITDYAKFFTTDSMLVDSMATYHYLDAVYAPFTGQVAPTLIELLLVDLEAMNSKLTVLGSSEWGVTEIPEERLKDRVIYFSESYYINSKSPRVEQFKEDFSSRFGTEASRYAMIGYDSADFLLRTLEKVKNPALLKEAFKNQPLCEGLISNIRFGGSHVNQEVKIFKISDQGIQPAVY